jgi:alkanesulfonate monooxygenase SsuD/methylene tetrahydromethanopterin reductase-like flavin-dependent oxidoreductase (luciferase family)
VSPEDAAKVLADVRLPPSGLRGTQLTGTAVDVAERLRDLVSRSAADELMVTATTHDPAVKLRTLELLAGQWPLDAA